MEDNKIYNITDLCAVVTAKTYDLPQNEYGRTRDTMYVESKYDIGKTKAYFSSQAKENGYYLIDANKFDLIYVAFILNSCVGNIFLHNEGSMEYVKGNVTKRNLTAVKIMSIPMKYRDACNILEELIGRVSGLQINNETYEMRDATVSFLSDIRNYICLEIYMKPVFVEHQVSILKPWERFVGKDSTKFSIDSIDVSFVKFYKSVVDPENEVMDAMKKVRLFMWELVEQIKERKR